MQKIIFLLVLTLTLNTINAQTISKHHAVNAIIGDKSYIEKFHITPNAYSSNQLRIQTHLAYVENELRNKSVDHLSTEEKDSRKQLLDYLKEYRLRGVYPKNYDYPSIRIPCFIDEDGNICAVGYLLEKTKGREFAEAFNKKYKYQYLMDVEDKKLNEWIKSSGLTKEECAMIQPTYEFMMHHEPIEQPIEAPPPSWHDVKVLETKLKEAEKINLLLTHENDSLLQEIKKLQLEKENLLKNTELQQKTEQQQNELIQLQERKNTKSNRMFLGVISATTLTSILSTVFLIRLRNQE